MVKCKCNKEKCKITYTKAGLEKHLKQNAAGAASSDTTKDKKIVMPYYNDGKSESEIAEITGKSIERIEKIFRKIKGDEMKQLCRELYEKGVLEHEAVSRTGLRPGRVKKIYNSCKKKKGLDVTTPTSPKSSDQILSINGETSFPIECKSCGKKKKQKMFVIERTVRTQSGAMVRSFEIEAEGRCECGALHSIKIIPDDVSS